MIGALKMYMVHLTRPYASFRGDLSSISYRTSLDQHAYQIWTLYLDPLRRSERRYQMGWFAV